METCFAFREKYRTSLFSVMDKGADVESGDLDLVLAQPSLASLS